MNRKITIHRGNTTLTIEDDGQTDVAKLVTDLERQEATAPFVPAITPRVDEHGFVPHPLDGMVCNHCGTHWPSVWMSIVPPCSCREAPMAPPGRVITTTSAVTPPGTVRLVGTHNSVDIVNVDPVDAILKAQRPEE